MAAISLVVLFAAGCSSVPKDYHDPEHVGYFQADHQVRVWLADEFKLPPAGEILIANPDNTVVAPSNPAQLEERGRALQTYLAQALNARVLHPRAVVDHNQPGLPEGAYRFETTIVDCYEGNRATSLSIIPGSFGAGHPWILVRGKLVDQRTGEPVFRFVAKRGFNGREAGDSWTGNEDPLDANIQDLAMDVADLLERARDGRPLTKN